MTEQSIIERAARALLARQEPSLLWDDLMEIDQEAYKSEARAVLITIWEPSAAMIEAGLAECSADWRESVCREFLPDIWKAMIDAALVKETPFS
jgi:hypothetical protein